MPDKSDQKSSPILELNNATVRWNETNILDHLSLKIDMHEHTAVIGPNGSGKSTLIKLLMHNIYPLARKDGSPSVRMFGKDHWRVDRLRSRLGIVSADLQRNFLNNTKGGRITGHSAVVSGFFSSLRLFPHQAITDVMNKNAAEALELMDAARLGGKMLNEMSEGEIRRVLIARAMVTSPDVLILDEPTTSLDFVARHTFMQQIRELVRRGTTLILVTHLIEEVIPEMKRVVLLKEGRAAFDGPKSEVLTSGNLSKVFGRRVLLNKRNGLYKVDVEM